MLFLFDFHPLLGREKLKKSWIIIDLIDVFLFDGYLIGAVCGLRNIVCPWIMK